jgi:hypothetical protein
MNPIHFTVNVPQVLSLKDTAGVIDGFNVAYETSDGKLLLLPYPAAVKLNMLDPQPGEEINVLKNQGHRLPAEWVFSLTPKSEQARAAKETQSELERQLAESLAQSPARAVRQMPKSARTSSPEPAEAPKGTGTYGPVPQVALGSRKRPDAIPYDVAFAEILSFVTKALNETGEQWSEQSRQDLVSTVLISSAKAGYLGVWQR